MREEIEDWFISLRLNWYHLRRLVKEVRGVRKDRAGRWYWCLEREWSPGHVKISLIPWPGLTARRRSVGWTAVSLRKGTSSWMIHDVQVPMRYGQRGIGTALIRAAIALARRRGARELCGNVMRGDAKAHPFLPAWYARLGFTVQPAQGGDILARFWMDLTPSQRETCPRKTASQRFRKQGE